MKIGWHVKVMSEDKVGSFYWDTVYTRSRRMVKSSKQHKWFTFCSKYLVHTCRPWYCHRILFVCLSVCLLYLSLMAKLITLTVTSNCGSEGSANWRLITRLKLTVKNVNVQLSLVLVQSYKSGWKTLTNCFSAFVRAVSSITDKQKHTSLDDYYCLIFNQN